jgi:hypothetical protein
VTNDYLLMTVQFVGSNTIQYMYGTFNTGSEMCTKCVSETTVMLKYIELTQQWKNYKLVNKG